MSKRIFWVENNRAQRSGSHTDKENGAQKHQTAAFPIHCIVVSSRPQTSISADNPAVPQSENPKVAQKNAAWPIAVTLEGKSELTSYRCHTLMKRKPALHDFVRTQKIALKNILIEWRQVECKEPELFSKGKHSPPVTSWVTGQCKSLKQQHRQSEGQKRHLQLVKMLSFFVQKNSIIHLVFQTHVRKKLQVSSTPIWAVTDMPTGSPGSTLR
ncbi:hypothetical protein MJT46_019049 [Ovis ammon polii x Ovis aries]|nr:hypothetical protein MJT46_019049 [Ovis ammon polii x Ovis aries]